MTKLDDLMGLANKGLHLFPLQPNSKVPQIKDWQGQSTTDPEVINFWLDTWPDAGWAIDTGKSNLLVIDVDVKHDKPGDASLDDLVLMNGDLPPTLTIQTPSGGRHLFFASTPVANSVDKLALGLDVRSQGGYVATLGTLVDGSPYQVITDAEIATAPDWLVELAGQARAPASTKAIEDLDTPGAVKRAEAYLENAPVAVQGQHGDQTTYQVAAKLRDLGISEPKAFDLMLGWNEWCVPSWSQDQLRQKVANAYRYGQNPIGANHPKAAFEPVPAENTEIIDAKSAKKAKRPKLYLKKPSDITTSLDHVALVDDVLDQQAMSVIYGESNTGKTFVAMDIAFHVATGRPWANKRAEQGAVVYVAAEGGKSAENRIQALKQRHELDDFPLLLCPCPVDLLRPDADTAPLIELVRQASHEYGPVRLVVIDTLSRAIAGGNENSPDDMGGFVRNVDAIRDAIKCHLMVVHHSGKDTAKGARGHSLLRAATDTELEVANRTISAKKQRDMEMGQPIGFELDVVELGTTVHGKRVSSCVVRIVDASARDAFGGEKLDHKATLVFQALQHGLAKGLGKTVNGHDCLHLRDWKKLSYSYDLNLVPGCEPWSGDANKDRMVFSRAVERLARVGYVVEVLENQWATVEMHAARAMHA